MAYTTPPTFIADTELAADDLNILGDDIEYLKAITDGVLASGCQVRRTSAQSIATGSDENINFDTENFDIGGWYTAGTKVIVPAGAIPDGFSTIVVIVVAAVKWETDGSGKRKLTILKNGSGIGNWKVQALDDDNTSIYLTEFTSVTSGDEIQLNVWQNSGGGLDVTESTLTVMRYAPKS